MKMKFEVSINLANPVFEQDGNNELVQILRKLADEVSEKGHEYSEAGKFKNIKSANGTVVGTFVFKKTHR